MTTPAASPIPAHRGGAITGHIMTRREIALMDYRLGMFAAANAITLPPRIAENRVEGYEAIPAWMIGASRANLSQMGR